jgi:hypothetical protein
MITAGEDSAKPINAGRSRAMLYMKPSGGLKAELFLHYRGKQNKIDWHSSSSSARHWLLQQDIEFRSWLIEAIFESTMGRTKEYTHLLASSNHLLDQCNNTGLLFAPTLE